MIDFNIDQIASEIDSGSFDAGSTGQQPNVPNTPINQSPFDPNLVIPYKANGKEIQEPLSTVIQRASMGYNYAQLVQQQKQREQAIAEREQQLQQQAQKWSQYDEYANSNPQWAEYVRQQWEQRMNFGGNQNYQQGQFQDQSPAMQSNLPPEVMKEIAELKSFVGSIKEQQQAQMQAEQDAALANEISTIQNEYPDIDLRATDPITGESMEQQVLRHAQAYGISSFRAAFRDMMFDKLVARSQTQAKETVAKTLQNNMKNGILGQSNSPMLQSQPVTTNLKGHSYHSLMDMAAKEFGLT